MDRTDHSPFDDCQSECRFRKLTEKLNESSDRGVAFFGAGASAPAGLPTWGKFHRSFLEHFGAQPSSDGPQATRAVLTDIDYHTDRHPARVLAFIKATFASPIPQIPPVVRFAVATRSLRFFYTTNFDEVLFEAAAGDNVATYPDYVPMDARFVYLHGRASSANSVHGELVLGSSGYDLAYNATVGGWARTQLYVLAPYTVIFIGFSMADRSVARSLEEITRAARYRREIASDGEATEVVSPLSWYILLKAPTRTDPGRNEEKRSRETYLRGLGLRVVWYQDGGNPDPYSGLLEVVQRIE